MLKSNVYEPSPKYSALVLVLAGNFKFVYFSKCLVGANCAVYGCPTSRNNKGISKFRVTRDKDDFSIKWRKNLEDIIKKDRVLDENLKKQIENQNLHICQLHFTQDLIYS